MRRIFALSIALVALVAAAPDARAGDFSFSVGSKLGAVDIVGARDVTDLGTRIGYRIDHVVVFGAIDYARYTTRTEFESPDFSPVGSRGSLLTAGAGVRYLFDIPEASRAIPYAVGTAFTVLPDFDREERAPDEIRNAVSIGGLLGFGANYYFHEAFSVGAEAGLDGLFARQSTATETWEGSVLQIYSGIRLSFFL